MGIAEGRARRHRVVRRGPGGRRDPRLPPGGHRPPPRRARGGLMAASSMGVEAGPDGRLRCWWCLGAPEYIEYHDSVWGRPMHGDRELFEMLVLESFQSGLSWLTILRKREGFRRTFEDWDIERIAAFGERDVERLLADSRIVRHRGKIEAAIANAVATQALHERGETLDALLWACAPERDGAHERLRGAREHAGIEGDGKGAEAARLPLRRADHRLRADAGGRNGQRPPRGMRASTAPGDRARGLGVR